MGRLSNHRSAACFKTVANITERHRTLTLGAVVDTAFTGYLTLPLDSIKELGLVLRGTQPAVLANGTVGQFSVYAGMVTWNGQERLTVIFESDSDPLIGMAMLWGSRLTVDAQEGGDVVIEGLPPQ